MPTRSLTTLLLALAACRPAVRAPPAPSPQLDALERLTEDVMALKIAPGMVIAVVQGDRVVHLRGYGVTAVDQPTPVTPDTQFYIASTTKALTALAALMQEHHGKLELGAPVARYLPGLKLTPPLDAHAITVLDLLNHTHGIAQEGPVDFRMTYTGEYRTAQLFELLALHRPAEHGRAFEYGNLGYNLAGMVLDPQREQGWKEVVEREVLAPLGMTDTTAYVSRAAVDRLARPHVLDDRGLHRVAFAKQDRNIGAPGGHLSTARDMVTFLRVELGGGRLADREVFPPSVIARSQTKAVDQDRTFGPVQRFGWGIGWDLGRYDGELLIHRFGAFQGFTSHLSFMPERGIGVVLLVNAGGPAGTAAHLVATHAYDVALGRADLERRRAGVLDRIRELKARRVASAAERRRSATAGSDGDLARLAGDYCNVGFGRIHVSPARSGLRITMGVMDSDASWLDAGQWKFLTELPAEAVIQFDVPPGTAEATAVRYVGVVYGRLAGAQDPAAQCP